MIYMKDVDILRALIERLMMLCIQKNVMIMYQKQRKLILPLKKMYTKRNMNVLRLKIFCHEER